MKGPRDIDKAIMAFWAMLCLFALLVIPVLSAKPVQEYFWAFHHLREVPLWIRLLLALLMITAIVPQGNRMLWRLLAMPRVFLVKYLAHRGLRMALLAAGCFALFWLLRTQNLVFGDTINLIRDLTSDIHLGGQHLTFDKPLEFGFHSLAYRLLHNIFNFTVVETYALVSSLCGVGAVLLILSFWRRAAAREGQKIAVWIFLSMGAMQLFFGYVENYTMVALGILIYYWLALRNLEGRCHLIWPAMVLSLSVCFHVLAGWLFPTLLYLWLVEARKGDLKHALRSLAGAAGAVAAPIVLTLSFCFAIGISPSEIKNTHLWNLKFIFLLDDSDPLNRYSMISVYHLTNVLNQIWLAALPGVMALTAALSERGKIDRKDAFFRFLLIAAVFLQFFAATWHPGLDALNAWALFAVIGTGYTMLGAYLLVKTVRNVQRLKYLGMAIIMLSLPFTIIWIALNSRVGSSQPKVHHLAHLQLGLREARKKNFDFALAQLKKAARLAPRYGQIYLNLGEVSLLKNDPVKAIRYFEIFLKLESSGPRSKKVRKDLARLKARLKSR